MGLSGRDECSFTGTYTVPGNTRVFDGGTADDSNAVITAPYRIVLRPA